MGLIDGLSSCQEMMMEVATAIQARDEAIASIKELNKEIKLLAARRSKAKARLENYESDACEAKTELRNSRDEAKRIISDARKQVLDIELECTERCDAISGESIKRAMADNAESIDRELSNIEDAKKVALSIKKEIDELQSSANMARERKEEIICEHIRSEKERIDSALSKQAHEMRIEISSCYNELRGVNANIVLANAELMRIASKQTAASR